MRGGEQKAEKKGKGGRGWEAVNWVRIGGGEKGGGGIVVWCSELVNDWQPDFFVSLLIKCWVVE